MNASRKRRGLVLATATFFNLRCATPLPAPETSSEAIELGAADEEAPRPASDPATAKRFEPCSDENPSGCTAGPALAKLDVNKRYSVTLNADDPTLGNNDAPVTLVVFSDFQCPFCGQLEGVLAQLRTRFGTQVRFVWKDLPLTNHAFALSAAVLAREAYVTFGAPRFWLVHDELFVHQNQLSDAWLSEFAKAQALTWPPDARYVPRIQQNVQLADQLAINATPTVFINGRPVIGSQDEAAYADVIIDELEHTSAH